MEYKKPLDLNLKKGALKRQLGVKQENKIPTDKLTKALGSSNPLEAKRARFAETMSHWNH